jgi:hypothetical protein
MWTRHLLLPIVYLHQKASFAEKSFGEFKGLPVSSGPVQHQGTLIY